MHAYSCPRCFLIFFELDVPAAFFVVAWYCLQCHVLSRSVLLRLTLGEMAGSNLKASLTFSKQTHADPWTNMASTNSLSKPLIPASTPNSREGDTVFFNRFGFGIWEFGFWEFGNLGALDFGKFDFWERWSLGI